LKFLSGIMGIDVVDSRFDFVGSLHERYRYAFWDAMIIASAIRCGAVILLSEDLADGQMVEGVRIVNPFRG
jgi:predicted nucleic acid-binding protein